MKISQSYGGTDPGRKRRRNEDAFVWKPPLFAVADGMGGAQAGEIASGLAAAALDESGASEGGERRVIELIQEANRRVHDRATTDSAASGMGTTITVALVGDDGHVAFGHVGDSRAYLLRDGTLDQITDDHSLVAELVRRGELSPAEAEVHPQRSVITRVLGTDPEVDVDTFLIAGKPGDIFLICSDGLSSMVDAEDMAVILERHRADLAAATRALIQAANRVGGDDNITALLFELADDSQPDEETREQTAPAAVEEDEADTLHPGQVAVPEAVDTMVVPPDQIDAVLQEQEQPPETEEEFEAGLGRRALALAVIVALCALIVVLVWWGLAR